MKSHKSKLKRGFTSSCVLTIAWARIIIAWARITIAWARIIIAWARIITARPRISFVGNTYWSLRGHALVIAWARIIIAWVRIIIARARINHLNLFYSWPFLASMFHRKDILVRVINFTLLQWFNPLTAKLINFNSHCHWKRNLCLNIKICKCLVWK